MSYAGYLPEYEAKKTICDLAKILAARRLVSGAGGSISVRCGKNTVWMTPAGLNPAFLTPDKLVRVALGGGQAYGTRQPQPPAAAAHLQIYAEAEDAKAVLDTVPPFFSALKIENRCAQAPQGARAEELRLCERAKRDQMLLMDGGRLLCWAGSVEAAYAALEQMDNGLYASGWAQLPQPGGEAEKQEVIRRIIERVTKIVLEKLSAL